MTETVSRYAEIEKKLLSVVFSLDTFEQYKYGRPVTVESDHKPLEAISKKPQEATKNDSQNSGVRHQHCLHPWISDVHGRHSNSSVSTLR